MSTQLYEWIRATPENLPKSNELVFALVTGEDECEYMNIIFYDEKSNMFNGDGIETPINKVKLLSPVSPTTKIDWEAITT